MPYQQTEAIRFGNVIVDEWEGKVNAWPLDEGLIDYVDPSYGGATDENPYAAINVIANPSFTLSGGRSTPARSRRSCSRRRCRRPTRSRPTSPPATAHRVPALGAGRRHRGRRGNRPWTDYAAGDACTGGNCDRRAAYLTAATDLLISDLEWMVAQWQDGGAARAAVTADPGGRGRRRS